MRVKVASASLPDGCKPLILLVEQWGIEPQTSALRTRRSAKLSYCPPGQNEILEWPSGGCQAVLLVGRVVRLRRLSKLTNHWSSTPLGSRQHRRTRFIPRLKLNAENRLMKARLRGLPALDYSRFHAE
jgi:hypothetical protein